MMSVGNLAITAIEFLGIWALFSRFGSLGEWTLPEVALFYGMVHMAFAISEAAARGFDILHRQVRSGDFDRILLRPRSTVLQVMGLEFQLLRVGRFTQGLGGARLGNKQSGYDTYHCPGIFDHSGYLRWQLTVLGTLCFAGDPLLLVCG